ncbi:leucine-rich repeat-containing protein 74A-like [Argopecten irradians]|uniref:leucine-rich repeat-containing protein 74A-like n=1 Tax=Argopecten irradians TaxID=31199 RepID=UPI00371FFEE0
MSSAELVTCQKNTHILSVRKGQTRFVRHTSSFYEGMKKEPGKKIARERSECTTPETDFDVDDFKIKKMTLRKYSKMLKAAHRFKCESKLSDDSSNEFDDYSDDDTDVEGTAPKRWQYNANKHYQCLCESLDTVPSSAFLRQVDGNTLSLSNSFLSQKDIRIMSVFLANNATILHVDISGNDIGQKGAISLAEAIHENVFITDLNVSNTNIDGKGVHALVKALLVNRTVTKLYLSGNKLDNENTTDLTKLIQESDYITDLDLSHNELDEVVACSLAPAIAGNVTLKRLVLAWNHFRRTGATLIVKAVCNNVELHEVDLSWNGLGEEGCRAFKEHLGRNQTLEILDISNNRIAFKSLGDFISGLVKNQTLTMLKMFGNPITTEGAEALCVALENCNTTAITEVNVKDTPVDEKLCMAIKKLQAVHNIKIITREPMGHRFNPIKQQMEQRDFDPAIVLFEYMRQENLRLIDLFRNLDRDQNNTISREEFREGFQMMNINLTEEGLDRLFNKMDTDRNTKVDLCEMMESKRQVAKMYLKPGANLIEEQRYKEMVAQIKQVLANARTRPNINIQRAPEKTHLLEPQNNNLLRSPRNSARKRSPNSARKRSPSTSRHVSPSGSNQLSPSRPNQLSPNRSNQLSPSRPNQLSPNRSNQLSPSRPNQLSPNRSRHMSTSESKT